MTVAAVVSVSLCFVDAALRMVSLCTVTPSSPEELLRDPLRTDFRHGESFSGLRPLNFVVQ
jgi:hypothetical protein